MIDMLYKDVSDRLTEKVTALRWVDLEYGQLEIPEETYPLQFPCALIDFPQMDFENELEGNQQASIMIQIRIGLDLYEDFHVVDGVESPDLETALDRLKIITDVHKALHRFETDYATGLMRVSIQTERRDDGIKVIALYYACMAKDDSAATVNTVVTGASLQINKS